MRNLLRAVLWFSSIFIFSFFIWRGLFSIPSETALISSVTQVASPTPSPVEVFEEPATLIVPKLGVEVAVESVGMDAKGRMDVPKNVLNSAWYNLGVRAGQSGNAVFAAHYDKPDGSPAVFYKLKTLSQGDVIQVIDASGKTKEFLVTETRIVKTNQFPLEEVFGVTDKKRVNLITCGGTWDLNKKDYSERTIVFSELKEN